jgi:hypothetical protein
MEYYPGPHFGRRSREGLRVDEVLRVGIQVASAVETAHRAKVLHRDIKPANILTSDYGRPGLADFGIAGAHEAGLQASSGLSMFYAAPEVLVNDTGGDEQSDVYALGATLYTMLAGRPAFSAPGGVQREAQLINRIVRERVPTLQRPEVPASLEHALRQAMAKQPADRPRSAVAFARVLQDIESELQLAPTPLEVPAEPGSGVPPERRDDGEGTRTRSIRTVSPSLDSTPAVQLDGTPISDAAVAAVANARPGVPTAEPVADTVVPISRVSPVPAPLGAPLPTVEVEPQPDGRQAPRFVVIGAAGVVLAALAAVILAVGSGDPSRTAPTTTVPLRQEIEAFAPAVPGSVTVGVQGSAAQVSWKPGQGAETGDTYRVVRSDQPGAEPVILGSSPARVPIRPGEHPCFRVMAQRGSILSEPSAVACG